MADRDRRLRGIQDKNRRAQEHLEILQGIVNAHVEAHPITFLAEPQNGPPASKYHVVVESFEPPDYIDLGIRIGEILHLYRSILDNLVWHLSIANTGEDPPPRASSIAFPIIDLKPSWKQKGLPRIASVAPEPAEIIRRAQPFRGRHAPNPEPLSLLAALNNMDKHRVIVPMAISTESFTQVGDVIASADDVTLLVETTGQSVEQGATVYVFHLSKPTEVRMEYHGAFAIALDLAGLNNSGVHSHYPFDRVLNDVSAEVVRITNELWPHL